MCVKNQTLTNQKCLVPCEGLYADIADDTLSQKLDAVHAVVQQLAGRMWISSPYLLLFASTLQCWFAFFQAGIQSNEERIVIINRNSCVLGLENLNQGVKRSNAVLQHLFPSTIKDENFDIAKRLTKVYHNYKTKYLKHLSFDPEKERLSEYNFAIPF